MGGLFQKNFFFLLIICACTTADASHAIYSRLGVFLWLFGMHFSWCWIPLPLSLVEFGLCAKSIFYCASISDIYGHIASSCQRFQPIIALICPGWAIIPPLRDRIFELAVMLAERRGLLLDRLVYVKDLITHLYT